MKMKKTALASAIALVLVAGTVGAATTTTLKGDAIFDRVTINEGGTVDISLLGLNAEGSVDTTGGDGGSTIFAVISSDLCTVMGGGDSADALSEGEFASTTKYVQLTQGLGRAHLTCAAGVNGEDSVQVSFKEKTSAGAINDITTETQKITISSASADDLQGLNVMAFSPAANDPRGEMDCFLTSDECSDKDDGIYGEMTAGTSGGEIVIWAGNSNAAGAVTITLTGPGGPITYTAEMSGGEASVTLDSQLTKAGEYFIEATMDDADNKTVSSVQLAYADKVNVWSTGIPTQLKLEANKERIANPDFTQTSFANDAVTQGVEIRAVLLDEYGNDTSHCNPIISEIDGNTYCSTGGVLTVSVKDSKKTTTNEAGETSVADKTDEEKVVADLTLSVPYSGTATDTLGDASNEVIQVGTTGLVASLVDASGNTTTIADSESLKITVVSTSLAAEIHSDFLIDKEAGTEFKAFGVNLVNNAGQLHVDTSNNAINPGELSVKNVETGETFTGTPDSDNVIEVQFDKATNGENQYLISDTAGSYSQVLVAGSAITAAASENVEFRNAHGQVVKNVAPSSITEDKLYYTLLPEVAFKLFDNFGNELTGDQPLTSDDTGEFTVSSSNGTVSYVTSDEKGVVGRFELVNDLPSFVAIGYSATGDTPFAGQDEITVNFTKAGVVEKTINLNSTIPAYSGLTTIQTYLEADAIPPNSQVGMTVEILDKDGNIFVDPDSSVKTNVTLTVNGQDGDSVTPVVSELKWTEQSLTQAQCESISGTLSENICITETALTSEQCQQFGYTLMDNVCQQGTETVLSSGSELDFAETNGRKILIVGDVPTEGQFSLKFTGADIDGNEVTTTKTINVQLGEAIPQCADDVTKCETKSECEASESIFLDSQCRITAPLSATATGVEDYGKDDPDAAQFAGGVNDADSNGTTFEQTLAFAPDHDVKIATLVKADKKHIGLKADLVVGVVFFAPSKEDYTFHQWYYLAGCDRTTEVDCPAFGWKLTEWRDIGGWPVTTDLEPLYEADSLPEHSTLYLYTGAMGFTGTAEVFVGYVVNEGEDNGKIVFNKEPIRMDIK
ncbi:hypothetical protein [Candidatus Parabeggiatoa sp. HSG14]|uniref:hypothetical protein n=1 Tax=Candidatus Parabeggiatoa sp. HSG14 TaxID=3055593 RepID=UPI0025A88C62|nr:hypothetical protein [Thiotrichales bacterium HSG14]